MTPFKPTEDDYLKSIFDKNLKRKIEAYERAHPEEISKFYEGKLDLRTIPRKEWDQCLMQPILCPPDVKLYLDGTKGEPLTPLEKDSMEERIEAFYEISEPYYIAILHDKEFDVKVALLHNNDAKE